ncbi:aminoglycoside 6-adenylyltransferase, partial [Legionella pneumophila]|uniref:aminoglycoside 6-adenylyltransferase n=1 Tax=Legionella pneumophila TaxID=446 RepID=UPI0011384AE5
PLIKPDKFQDFDIVYLVNDIDIFLDNPNWIDVFGERFILQMPDNMVIGQQENQSISFSYLMLFKDGNRIDQTLFPLEKFTTDYKHDSLTLLLLDKDGLFLNLPISSDSDYHITKPSQKLFTDCCNEFWWVCTNV